MKSPAAVPGLGRLLALVWVQMVPATLVAPAIRPLFAALHGGDEGAMHGFMSVNMLAAALVAPWLAPRVVRRSAPTAWLLGLTVLDGVLLAACALRLPVAVVLALRAVEGAAHVSAATVLLSEAATRVRKAGRPELMGAVGGAIMLAIASGSSLGAALVTVSPRAPFFVAGALAVVTALSMRWALGPLSIPSGCAPAPSAGTQWPVLAGAFVARFSIGCLVVSFSLFAHRAHQLSDGKVGALFAGLTVPFALATWPAAKVARRVGLARVLAVGAVGWALVLSSLAWLPTAMLPVAMVLGGVACAALFASTLGFASQSADPQVRAQSLSRFNAAGALGMVVGPPAAGIAAVLAGRGVAGDRAAFLLAATALMGWLISASPWLLRRMRVEGRAVQPRSLQTQRVRGARLHRHRAPLARRVETRAARRG